MLRDNITFGATPPQPGRAGLLCLGLAVIVCVFMAACAAVMWWQPLTTDENDFFLAIAHWTEWRYLIPHPQLYVHWAQALVGLFGANVGAVRLSVLIPSLLTIALLVWLGRLLYGGAAGKRNWPAISGLAVLLWPESTSCSERSAKWFVDHCSHRIALPVVGIASASDRCARHRAEHRFCGVFMD